MPENPLEIGDSVQLRSGGPIMTVTGLDRDQGDRPTDVKVQWFAAEPPDTLHTEYFPPAALKRATEA